MSIFSYALLPICLSCWTNVYSSPLPNFKSRGGSVVVAMIKLQDFLDFL
ncbi:mCG148056 [Mus musculus]|nr:mCG148056 [Mus musculus]